MTVYTIYTVIAYDKITALYAAHLIREPRWQSLNSIDKQTKNRNDLFTFLETFNLSGQSQVTIKDWNSGSGQFTKSKIYK